MSHRPEGESPKELEMTLSNHLQPILDSMLDMLFIVDKDGIIAYANARLCALTGFEPQKAVGTPILQFIPEGERERVYHKWQAVRTDEAQEFESQFRTADDRPITCLIAVSRIRDTESFLFVVRDLTEAQNMQAQLIQSEKAAALGQLVAGAAHALNNPLTAVLGFAQILREEADDEMVQADLDRIIRGALRARDIVRDLLHFARQHSPSRSYVGINATLKKAVEDASKRALKDEVAIETELAEALPLILANPQQLKLVWDNLLNNACQAMAPQRGGELCVKSQRIDDFVRVTISDTGPGIPTSNIPRIFDPFFTTKAIGEGVGLGLSLCQGIIESHHGQIWVESTEGKGATFVVELPVPIDPTSQGADGAGITGSRDSRQPA